VIKALKSGVPLERHAYRIYTNAMFEIFSDLLFKSGSFIVRGPPEGGNISLEHFDAERREKYFKVKYNVYVDLVGGEFTCECGFFEHTGMLCRHVLKVRKSLTLERNVCFFSCTLGEVAGIYLVFVFF
jgi:hypothetical protein